MMLAVVNKMNLEKYDLVLMVHACGFVLMAGYLCQQYGRIL